MQIYSRQMNVLLKQSVKPKWPDNFLNTEQSFLCFFQLLVVIFANQYLRIYFIWLLRIYVYLKTYKLNKQFILFQTVRFNLSLIVLRSKCNSKAPKSSLYSLFILERSILYNKLFMLKIFSDFYFYFKNLRNKYRIVYSNKLCVNINQRFGSSIIMKDFNAILPY